MKRYLILITIICVIAVFLVWLFGRQTLQTPPPLAEPRGTSSFQEEESAPLIPVGDSITSTIPILVYHSIAPKPEHAENKTQLHYRITPENFEKQMQYLKDQGYEPITFARLVEHLTYETSVPEKAVVLTFDDGWKNNYDHAVPVLKKYGFTGTFFIVTKTRGGSYMTWDEILDLDHTGMEIASHTETHANLAKSTSEVLIKEITGSKKILEEKLGHSITTLAYPYYAQNEAVRESVRTAGYQGARAGWAKFTNSTDHIFEMVSQEAVNNPNPFATVRLPG